MTDAGTQRWRRAPGVLWRRVAETVVVLPADAAEAVELSGAGAVMWTFLDAPLSADDVEGLLVERYGTTDGTVAGHVEPFLASLAARGLVTGA